jgi:hypothetical protein
MKLDDLKLLSIGNTIQLAGAIYAGEGRVFLCEFPEENLNGTFLEYLHMDYVDWVKFIRQTDLMETEIIQHNPKNGEMVKAIVRKSQRQIDNSVSWKVFHRDNYSCRYCGGKNGTPLTVDHVITWESGGPSIPENLVSACKKCNRTRGETKYEDWLASDYYRSRSGHLADTVREQNIKLIETLSSVPRVVHKRSR